MPNVIGTPHVAALVEGWRKERVAEAARVARALLATGEPPAGSRLEDPADYRDLR
jgi:phosphoglycerate dehydrogenase-like enzyme